jgi:uncharacterized protein
MQQSAAPKDGKKPKVRLFPDKEERQRSYQWMKYWGPSIVFVIAGFAVAYHFVQPAPPRSLSMATGDPRGAYHRYGEYFQKELAKRNISLRLMPTAGSLENLDLLRRGAADVAFVQGGTVRTEDGEELEALAALFLEPFWVFCRTEKELDDLTQLAGMRIAAGGAGSGTRSLLLRFLHELGMTADDFELMELNDAEALAAMRTGAADAAVFVLAPDAPLIGEMLAVSGVRLMSLRRYRAWLARYPFLSAYTAGEGMIDLAANLPARECTLVSPRALLAAQHDLHPALVTLLLQIAGDLDRSGALDESKPRPPADHSGLPLHDEAERYFTEGPGMLQRYLPFWAATLIGRLKIMLLPFITLLLPLFKMGPPLYRWRMRLKIYRWYGLLHRIDRLHKAGRAQESVGADIERLHLLEKELTSVHVPLSYMAEFYDLHLHIGYVLDELRLLACKLEEAAREDRPV